MDLDLDTEYVPWASPTISLDAVMERIRALGTWDPESQCWRCTMKAKRKGTKKQYWFRLELHDSLTGGVCTLMLLDRRGIVTCLWLIHGAPGSWELMVHPHYTESVERILQDILQEGHGA